MRTVPHLRTARDPHVLHLAHALRLATTQRDRPGWTRGQILEAQTQGLRSLVGHAQAHAPMQAARLGTLDPAVLTATHLDSVAPMTKRELMDDWERALAVRGLSRARAEAHLTAIGRSGEHAYVDDGLTLIESSGTSGLRGLFLWDWDGFAQAFAGSVSFSQWLAARLQLTRISRRATIAAGGPQHATAALSLVFQGRSSFFPVERIPASLPLDERIERLRAAQPEQLHCYPTIIPALLEATRSGALPIAPRVVSVSSETVPAGLDRAVAQTWGACLLDVWAASEALLATTPCPLGGMHLRDDLVVFELLDADDRPIGPGETSDKILITTLYNRAMPIIRLEISDRFQLASEPCACGLAYTKIERVAGRQEELLVFSDGRRLHPVLLYDRLSLERAVREYRVSQRGDAVRVELALGGPAALDELAAGLRARLGEAGVRDPRVELEVVDTFARTWSGKRGPS